VDEQPGTAEVEFDIDYIMEWIRPEDREFRFRVAPATLTFHNVIELRMVIDFAAPGAGMTPMSIDGIRRELLRTLPGQDFFRWTIPINWPDGEITFKSSGFTQVLRGDPIEQDVQGLRVEHRGR
jgi:hypothetical protein